MNARPEPCCADYEEAVRLFDLLWSSGRSRDCPALMDGLLALIDRFEAADNPGPPRVP